MSHAALKAFDGAMPHMVLLDFSRFPRSSLELDLINNLLSNWMFLLTSCDTGYYNNQTNVHLHHDIFFLVVFKLLI